MKNKIIPYSRQFVDEEDQKAVVRVLKSDYLTQGPEVRKFENTLSKFCNVNYSIALNSATSALHSSCVALGIGNNDLVWTVPITFVATANAALYCGATIDFVDIDSKTWCISPEKLENKLKFCVRNKKRLPSLLIVVHLGGQSCEMEKIFELSVKYNFKVIEDASHGLGGLYKNKRIGSCQYSDVVVFSFHPVKIISSGEGGVAVTNSKKIADKIADFRSHGIVRDRNRMEEDIDSPWYYEQQSLGFNYRLSDIHAALGSSQMKKISKFAERRNEIRNLYIKNLTGLVRLQHSPKESVTSNHLFIIRVPQNKHKEIFVKLREKNIFVGLHYMPVHLNPFYKKIGFEKGMFPEAEAYSKEAISLPMFPKLQNREIKFVLSNLKKLL